MSQSQLHVTMAQLLLSDPLFNTITGVKYRTGPGLPGQKFKATDNAEAEKLLCHMADQHIRHHHIATWHFRDDSALTYNVEQDIYFLGASKHGST